MYIAEIEFGTPEYDEEVALRDKILRQPLGLKYEIKDIEQEYRDIHFGCYYPNGQLAGCLLLLSKSNAVLKMRQVAVASDAQRKGIGQLLVQASEDYARRNGYREITLHAREQAVPFYLKLGYEITGEPFTEVGIIHLAMKKTF